MPLKTLKNAQKANFWAKVIMRYFQKYTRYECKVLWGSKDIPWAHFETITRSPAHPATKTPTPLVNSCLFGRFLGYFYLQLELGKKLVNICWQNFWRVQLIPKSPHIPNIIIIQQLEVLIFYFQSHYAFWNSYSKGKCLKKR